MRGFKTNIEKATQENKKFRKVLYTGKHSQLVLMSLLPKEDIGMCRRPRKKVHSWPWWSRGGEFFQNGLSRSFLDPFPLIVFHSFFPS